MLSMTIIIFIEIAFAFKLILRGTHLLSYSIRSVLSCWNSTFLSNLISKVFIKPFHFSYWYAIVSSWTSKKIFEHLLFFLADCIIHDWLSPPASTNVSFTVSRRLTPFRILSVYCSNFLETTNDSSSYWGLLVSLFLNTFCKREIVGRHVLSIIFVNDDGLVHLAMWRYSFALSDFKQGVEILHVSGASNLSKTLVKGILLERRIFERSCDRPKGLSFFF